MLDDLEIEGIDGIVDDSPKIDPPVDDSKQLISGLQDQITNMQGELKGAQTAKHERDEMVDRFKEAVGFIEGSGVGKYDPSTGSITRLEKEPVGPDPIELIAEEIKDTKRELLAQYKNGDIEQDIYMEKLQDIVAPLQEKRRDLISDQKISKMREEFVAKQQPEAKPVVDNAQAYIKLTDQYKDADDTNSDLYKKMNDIFMKNPKIYGNANYDDGKGDPDQYRDLIERAVVELKADGVTVKTEKETIRNQFATPENKGYAAPTKKAYALVNNDINMMVTQGINSKSLLRDTNIAINSWMETGQMVLED